jgi:small subunit ribosomal protein S16
LVKIRLTRAGSKNNTFYRIVAADVRAPRDGKFLEILGYYDPTREPNVVKLDKEKYDNWVSKGAQTTDRVRKIIAQM